MRVHRVYAHALHGDGRLLLCCDGSAQLRKGTSVWFGDAPANLWIPYMRIGGPPDAHIVQCGTG